MGWGAGRVAAGGDCGAGAGAGRGEGGTEVCGGGSLGFPADGFAIPPRKDPSPSPVAAPATAGRAGDALGAAGGAEGADAWLGVGAVDGVGAGLAGVGVGAGAGAGVVAGVDAVGAEPPALIDPEKLAPVAGRDGGAGVGVAGADVSVAGGDWGGVGVCAEGDGDAGVDCDADPVIARGAGSGEGCAGGVRVACASDDAEGAGDVAACRLAPVPLSAPNPMPVMGPVRGAAGCDGGVAGAGVADVGDALLVGAAAGCAVFAGASAEAGGVSTGLAADG
ncbi:MAG: hypothetical protein AAF253_06605 [Pseudomonadota bacterium]